MTNLRTRSGVQAMQGFGLSAFSLDQLDTIHMASLHVLNTVGVKVESDEALEIYASGGARIEKKEGFGIVYLPAHLIEDGLRWAPSSVTFCGRDPQKDFVAEPNRVGFATFGECISVIDPVTREHRPSTKKDCGETARLVDALDEIVVMERAVCSGDQFSGAQPAHNFEAIVNNTSKHVFLGVGNRKSLEIIHRMACSAVGGHKIHQARPLFTPAVCPTSPLTLVENCCDVIIQSARAGIGVWIIPMVMAGGTGPVTLAGTLVQHNAEVLSALVLAQLSRKGTPCTYGSCTTVMDLRSAAGVVGAPEYGILNAGVAKMAQYYRLPCQCGGGHSDSKIPDAQAAYETTLSATVSALAGANIVYGAGCMDFGLTFDFAKLVMDCELFRNLNKVLEGIPTDEYSLAREVIEKVGPAGTYLMEKHTMDNMRKSSQAVVFDRRTRDAWEKDGGKDTTERAYAIAVETLATHEPMALPPGAKEEISNMVGEFEAKIAKSG